MIEAPASAASIAAVAIWLRRDGQVRGHGWCVDAAGYGAHVMITGFAMFASPRASSAGLGRIDPHPEPRAGQTRNGPRRRRAS